MKRMYKLSFYFMLLAVIVVLIIVGVTRLLTSHYFQSRQIKIQVNLKTKLNGYLRTSPPFQSVQCIVPVWPASLLAGLFK